MSQRLPIFRDDLSFEDNHRRMFSDMRRRMDNKRSYFDDDFDQMCGNFFKLRPSSKDPFSHVKRNDEIHGSRESLDDNAVKSLFVENPETKSRTFQISFDVKDYEPDEISVKVQDDTLIVEAKHEKMQEGNKLVTEFNRKFKIPPEVDTEKLSSSLSNDGVLSITAPVPPQYFSVTDGRSHSPAYAPTISPPQSHAQHSPSFPNTVGGRNSPLASAGSSSPLASGGRNSPLAHGGRNSPLASVNQGFTQSTSPLASPPLAPEPKTQPKYRNQMYMVPQSRLQNGLPVSAQTDIPPTNPQQQQPPAARPKTPPLDTPTFYNTGMGCEMVLLMDIGSPYTPEDLIVKVDGKNLIVEATHEENTNGKKSKSSFAREFVLNEQVDPNSVSALLKEGRLKITGLAQ